MAPPRKAPAKRTAPAAAATSGPKVTKKAEGAPKHPLSSYQLWYKENRESVLANSKIKNRAKAAHSAWKKLEDKTQWQQKAKEEKERYQREMAEYDGNGAAAPASESV